MKEIRTKIKESFFGVACALSMGVLVYSYINQQEIIKEKNYAIASLEQINQEETEKVAILSQEKESLQAELESARQRSDDIRREIERNTEEIERIKLEKTTGRKITVKVTGYCPCSYCCGEWASLNPGITASGTVAKYGTIAAPTSIPFGTKMKIDGYGDMIFTVEDTGGAVVYENGIYVIDMWMPTHEQAYAVGNSIVEATIIE